MARLNVSNFLKQGGPLSIAYTDADGQVHTKEFVHIRPGGSIDDDGNLTNDDGDMIFEDSQVDPTPLSSISSNFPSIKQRADGEIEFKDDQVNLENRNQPIILSGLLRDMLPIRNVISNGHVLQVGRTEMIYQSNIPNNNALNVVVNSQVIDSYGLGVNNENVENMFVYDLNFKFTEEVAEEVYISPISGYLSLKDHTSILSLKDWNTEVESLRIGGHVEFARWKADVVDTVFITTTIGDDYVIFLGDDKYYDSQSGVGNYDNITVYRNGIKLAFGIHYTHVEDGTPVGNIPTAPIIQNRYSRSIALIGGMYEDGDEIDVLGNAVSPIPPDPEAVAYPKPVLPIGENDPLERLYNSEAGEYWWGYITKVQRIKEGFEDATESSFWFDVPGMSIKTVPMFGSNVVYLRASVLHTMSNLSIKGIKDVTKFRIIEYRPTEDDHKVIADTEVSNKSTNHIITKDVIMHGIDVVDIESTSDSDELVQVGENQYVVSKEPKTKTYKVQYYYADTSNIKEDGKSFLGIYLNYIHKEQPVSKLEITVVDLFKNTFFEKGTISGNGQMQANISFKTGFGDDKYSIQLSQTGVYPVWYENKTNGGFVLKSSSPLKGTIRWTAIRRLTPDWKEFNSTDNTAEVFKGEGNLVESDYDNS